MGQFKNIIIEGIDQIGKSTLIEGLYQNLGYFQELHFQKPRLLEVYLDKARHDHIHGTSDAVIKREALKQYQIASFTQMFCALKSNGRFLMNRSHLGEFVYSKRYRGYDGDYVFDMEQKFNEESNFAENTLLVLVHTSDLSFITDDGQSLGTLDMRDGEQMDFIKAFETSIIKHKVMIDVTDGSGNFTQKNQILNAVLNAWNRFYEYGSPILHVTWNKEGDSVHQINHLQDDPKKGVS